MFIHRDPHWCECRVKEGIHIRFHPNNINRDSGIEIPEAWLVRSKYTASRERCNSGPLREEPLAGKMEQWDDQNTPITADLCDINDAA